MINFSSRDIIE